MLFGASFNRVIDMVCNILDLHALANNRILTNQFLLTLCREIIVFQKLRIKSGTNAAIRTAFILCIHNVYAGIIIFEDFIIRFPFLRHLVGAILA